MKNWLTGFNSQLDTPERKISQLEKSTVETIQTEALIENIKRLEKDEESLSELWHNIKQTQVGIITGVS